MSTSDNKKKKTFNSIDLYYESIYYMLIYGLAYKHGSEVTNKREKQLYRDHFFTDFIKTQKHVPLKVLPPSIWSPITKNKEDKSGRPSSTRQYINNNTYRPSSSYPWYNVIFSGYGYDEGMIGKEKVPDDNLKPYKNLCELLILHMILEMHNIKSMETQESIHSIREAIKCKKDDVDNGFNINNPNSVSEKYSKSFIEIMKKQLYMPYPLQPDINSEFKNIGENDLSDFIDFVSIFSPLSALGYFLKQHLYPDNNELNSLLLVRGIDPSLMMAQEYIYRVLFAKRNGYNLKLKNRLGEQTGKNSNPDIKSFDLCYLGKSLYDIDGPTQQPNLNKVYPYVKFTKDNKICAYPLYKGNYASIIENFEEEVYMFTVDFYSDKNETIYLIERMKRGSCFSPSQLSVDLKSPITMQSPYYKEALHCQIYRFEMKVKNDDLDAFYDWIASFGEFAQIIKSDVNDSSKSQSIQKETTYTSIRIKSKATGVHPSLLTQYNSFLFAEAWNKYAKALWAAAWNKYSIKLSKNSCIICPSSPPATIFELEWLQYVLKRYSNIAEIFLSEDKISEIHKKLDDYFTEIDKYPANNKLSRSWLLHPDDNIFTTKDMDKSTAEEIRNILHLIKCDGIRKYEYEGRQSHVMPYLIEYNITSNDYSVLCYDLDHHRILIPKKSSNFFSQKGKILYKEISFEDYLKNLDANSKKANEKEKQFKLYYMSCYLAKGFLQGLIVKKMPSQKSNGGNSNETPKDSSKDCCVDNINESPTPNTKSNKEHDYLYKSPFLSYLLGINDGQKPTKEDVINKAEANQNVEEPIQSLLDFIDSTKEKEEIRRVGKERRFSTKLNHCKKSLDKCVRIYLEDYPLYKENLSVPEKDTNTFDYLNDYLKGYEDETSEYHTDIRHHGISKFSEAEIQYRTITLLYMRLLNEYKNKDNILELLDTPTLLSLIKGVPNDKNLSSDEELILNEVTYINEKIKSSYLTLQTGIKFNNNGKRTDRRKELDHIYSLFRDFNCHGFLNENDMLEIVIQYEHFDYRKVHMAIMALGNLVEVVEKKSPAVYRIINERKRNKKEISKIKYE